MSDTTTKPSRMFRREYKDASGVVTHVEEGQVEVYLKSGDWRGRTVVASLMDFAGREHRDAFRCAVTALAKAHKVQRSGNGDYYFPAQHQDALKAALDAEGFKVVLS